MMDKTDISDMDISDIDERRGRIQWLMTKINQERIKQKKPCLWADDEEVLQQLDNKPVNLESVRDALELTIEIHNAKERKRELELKTKADKIVFTNKERIAVPKKTKEVVFHKYHNKCTMCEESKYLKIHHKNENPADNRITNLLLLCPLCHDKIHA